MTIKFALKNIQILVVFLLLSMISTAQTSEIEGLKKEIDSLRQVLLTAKDTTRVKALIRMCARLRNFNSDSAIIYAEQAYNEAVSINYNLGAANALRNIGVVYRFIGNIKEEGNYFRRMMPYYETSNEKEVPRYVHSWVGENLYGQCRYQEALIEYRKFLAEIPRVSKNLTYDTAYAYNNIGTAYFGLGEYEKAYNYLLASLKLSLSLEDTVSKFTIQAYAYESMGDLYLNFDEIETANFYYEKSPGAKWDDQWSKIRLKANIFLNNKRYDSALVYHEKHTKHYLDEVKSFITDSAFLYNIIQGLNLGYGPILIGLKEYDKVIYFLEPALAHFSSTGHVRNQLTASFNLASAYLGKNELKKSLKNAELFANEAGKLKLRDKLRDGYQLLSEIYEKSGNKDKANLYYRKYAELKDELKTDQFKQKLQLYKAEEKEKQRIGAIKQLKKEKQWLSIGIILLATTVASFLAFIWVQRKSLARKKLLQQQKLALKEAENEKRIAGLEMLALRSQMNPHFIFNCLNSINRFVLRNDTESASNYLTKFSKLMRMVLENSKQPLIPLEEEVKCLELYMQMEQFRCKNAFTYYIKYHDNVNTEEAMIPPLLLQPFVENAIWHGVNPKEGNGEIGIEFFQRGDNMYCIIQDNGVGRKKASELRSQLSDHHKSMGLEITKERLAALDEDHNNGSPIEIIDLFDKNGSAVGTRVTIRIFSLPAIEELKSFLNI